MTVRAGQTPVTKNHAYAVAGLLGFMGGTIIAGSLAPWIGFSPPLQPTLLQMVVGGAIFVALPSGGLGLGIGVVRWRSKRA